MPRQILVGQLDKARQTYFNRILMQTSAAINSGRMKVCNNFDYVVHKYCLLLTVNWNH